MSGIFQEIGVWEVINSLTRDIEWLALGVRIL
jgi:hypothetical protein